MIPGARPPGLLNWERAWEHVANLPAPLSSLVHDALAEMIKVLMDEAAELGEKAESFDLLLFAKGAERFCRGLPANQILGVRTDQSL